MTRMSIRLKWHVGSIKDISIISMGVWALFDYLDLRFCMLDYGSLIIVPKKVCFILSIT